MKGILTPEITKHQENKPMKIEIARSFSKKIQLKQYEPIEFFCSAKAEVEIKELGTSTGIRNAVEASEELDRICQAEVQKSANKFRNVDHTKSKDVGIDDFVEDLIHE